MNIGQQIINDLRSDPDRVAIVNFRSGRKIRAGELVECAESLAQKLAPQLPKKKSVVAVSMPNSEEYVATVLALWSLNHAVMPLPSTLAESEIERIVARGPAIALFRSGAAGLSQLKAEARMDFPTDDLAFIRFTSGTTEDARGVLISHGAISARAKSFALALDLAPGKSVLWHLDMSYHFTTSIAAFLLNRCTLHLGSVLLPAKFAEWIGENKIDYFFSLPFFYEQLAQFKIAVNFPPQTKLFVTGQSIAKETLIFCKQHYGKAVRRMYGIIEVGIPVINGDSEDPSILGKLVSPYEIKIEADDAIQFRGPGTFSGYLTGENFEYRPFSGDWFNTGDLGKALPNGEIQLLGRRKEMIVSSIHKFFPSEVESVLKSHPGVRDAAIFLMTDGKSERLSAIFVSDTGQSADALIAYLRNHIEHAKVPEKFRRVRAVPRTASGKVSRNPEALMRAFREGSDS